MKPRLKNNLFPNITNSTHSLIRPANAQAWRAYDDIRRKELFEARGRFNYQPNHPDEYEPGNHPFLLLLGDAPIGTVRVDLPPGKRTAIFRLIAISSAHQRQGHGTLLMQLAEEFALKNDRPLFVVNSAPDAVGFYETLGYRLDPSSPENEPAHPRMVRIADKRLKSAGL